MTQWLVLGGDGVINEAKPGGVLELADWQPIAGSLEAIACLTKAGYKLAVASNQSVVGRGILSEAQLQQLNAQIKAKIQAAGGDVEGFFYCPHVPEEQCDCRKPRTGLFAQIEQEFDVSLAQAYCVGDSLKDIQAARAQGCRAVLVRTGKGVQTETATLLWPKYGENTLVFDNLLAFALHLLNE